MFEDLSLQEWFGGLALANWFDEDFLANSVVAPSVGAVTVTGLAPTAVRTQNVFRTPGVGAIVLTGRAPTPNQIFNRIPNVGAITITGRAPTPIFGRIIDIPITNLTIFDSQESATNTGGKLDGDPVAFGQSFLGTGVAISAAAFHILRSNSPGGTLTAEIYASTTAGLSIVSLPTGSALAVSNGISPSTLATSTAFITFTFPTPLVLTNAQAYFIVLRLTGGAPDGTNFVEMRTASGSGAHAGRPVSLSSGGTWASSGSADLTFRVYSGVGTAGVVIAGKAPTAVVNYRQININTTNTIVVAGGTPVIGAFPEVRSFKATSVVFQSSHVIPYPSDVQKGDRVIFIDVRSEKASVNTQTSSNVPAVNSTLMQDDISGSEGNFNIKTWVADGTEGGTSLTITYTSPQNGLYHIYIISRHGTDYETSPVFPSLATSGSTGTPNPANLDPAWLEQDTLWLAVAARDTVGTSQPIVSYPSGYRDGNTITIVDVTHNGIQLSSAIIQKRAGSEDPGVFTYSANGTFWVAQTLGFRPIMTRPMLLGAIVFAGKVPTVAINAAGAMTVQPGVGAIVLTGRAPTAIRTANVFRTPGVGAVVLTGRAPTNFIQMYRVPGVGAITLTGRAPTVAVTANKTVLPGVGAIVLTGRAPTAVRTANVFRVPGVGAITLTGLAPTAVRTANVFRVPNVGAITLTGRAPTLVVQANQTVSPNVGAIVLTGRAPTTVRTLNHLRIPNVGAIALSGLAPTAVRTANVFRTTGVGAITLTGRAPSIAAAGIVVPDVGTITLTGRSPAAVVAYFRAPNVGAIVLTGRAPTAIRTANVFRIPGVGAIVLTGRAPTAVRTQNVFCSPNVGAIALTGRAPVVAVAYFRTTGLGTITVAGLAPIAVRTQNQFRIPGVGAIALTGRAPVAVRTQNVFRTPNVGNIALVGLTPTTVKTLNHLRIPAKGNITFTGQPPATAGTSQVGVGAITLTGRAPTAVRTTGTFRTTGVGAITLVGLAPIKIATSRIVITGVNNIALAGIQPFKLISDLRTASPGKGNIAFTGRAPIVVNNTTRIPNVGAIALTGRAPTAVRTANHFRTPAAGSITITGRTPISAPTGNHIVAANKGQITVTGYAPSAQMPLAAPAAFDDKWKVDAHGTVWYAGLSRAKWIAEQRSTSWYNRRRDSLWVDPQE